MKELLQFNNWHFQEKLKNNGMCDVDKWNKLCVIIIFTDYLQQSENSKYGSVPTFSQPNLQSVGDIINIMKATLIPPKQSLCSNFRLGQPGNSEPTSRQTGAAEEASCSIQPLHSTRSAQWMGDPGFKLTFLKHKITTLPAVSQSKSKGMCSVRSTNICLALGARISLTSTAILFRCEYCAGMGSEHFINVFMN